MPSKSTTKKKEEEKPQVAVIDTLLGLRADVEAELDGRHSDRVTVGLNAVSRAIGLLGDNIQTEAQLERP